MESNRNFYILLLLSLYIIISHSSCSNYSPQSAQSWADDHCSRDSQWLCAEFTARALAAGGLFEKCSPNDTSKCFCNGPYGNLCSVSNLVKSIKSSGMKAKGSGSYNACKNAKMGDVGIYLNEGHASFMLGNCKIDQHNPNHCSSTADWDSPVIYGC